MEKKLPLEPLFDRVLLRRPMMQNKGNIIIPEEVARRHAPTKGVCVAIGASVEKDIVVGKTYIWGPHAGIWVNAEGTPQPQGDQLGEDAEFYVCAETDLIAEVIER